MSWRKKWLKTAFILWFKEGGPVHHTKCPLCLEKEAARFMGYKLKGKQGLFPEREYKLVYRVFRCERCDLIYGDDERDGAVARVKKEESDVCLNMIGAR